MVLLLLFQSDNPFLNGTAGMTEEELMMNRHLVCTLSVEV